MSKKNKNNKKAIISSTAPVTTPENVVEESAPIAPAEEMTQGEVKSSINVIDMGKFTESTRQNTAGGMDPNRQVDLMKMMHETFRIDPDAAAKYGMVPDAVDKINRITAIGQVALLANEIAFAQNPFAIRSESHNLRLFSK